GCGCCTFLCPTCHCFDIADEGTYRRGARRKNWDGCQFSLFTLHASGHNPRPDQAARWRNRVQHKYTNYVSKFGHRSCVGCGRCIRHCPVNMNILAQLQQIAAL
ncbi:MAG: 4Fe-4S ferredoxin, partial [Planctomycetes bacterium]|nr:4Fe-4S ferredoxin [Planctomycetota bacterium]